MRGLYFVVLLACAPVIAVEITSELFSLEYGSENFVVFVQSPCCVFWVQCARTTTKGDPPCVNPRE